MRENTLWVTVDGDYKFPQVELSAMADNMGKLIQDIDKLDRYQTIMMEELKHLRDITLFHDRLHPELHVTTKNP